MAEILRILNLGVGVQSSTVLLQSHIGELPPLDHAIFADTGDETDAVYEYLEYLKSIVTVPIHVVRHTGRALSAEVTHRIAEGRRLDNPPFFTASKDGGRSGPIMRDCTREYKIVPIRRKVKEILGLSPRGHWPKSLVVEQWLGISVDESRRMKCSTDAWMRFWHPLIEKEWVDDFARAQLRSAPVDRAGCVKWMLANGFREPPESSCWHCPFHANTRWRHLKKHEPHNWDKACEFDTSLRAGPDGLIHGMKQLVYLHRSLKPLAEADIGLNQQSLFGDECAGVCGV